MRIPTPEVAYPEGECRGGGCVLRSFLGLVIVAFSASSGALRLKATCIPPATVCLCCSGLCCRKAHTSEREAQKGTSYLPWCLALNMGSFEELIQHL